LKGAQIEYLSTCISIILGQGKKGINEGKTGKIIFERKIIKKGI